MLKQASRGIVSAIGLVAALVGQADAQVAVSSGGSPTYSHPIVLPPGTSGMQPNLSIAYAGGGVNGPVGHGWSVQGISAITRCPATRLIDGAPRGVEFKPSDKLCLDGQRLIQTNEAGTALPFPQADDAAGLGASAYREYRTENDTFARVRAYGNNAAAANGPAYFRIWTKAGQIYEYGAVPTSLDTGGTNSLVLAQGKSVVMVWAVARIKDVVGNYIDFRYEQRDVAWGTGTSAGTPLAGHEWNIAEIRYTGSSSGLPSNKVVFNYSDRVEDRSEAYQWGSKNISVRLLSSIDVFINANATPLRVRTTKLTYSSSPVTQRARVESIQDCGGAQATLCQPAARFNYSAGADDAFVSNTNFANSALASARLHYQDGTHSVLPIDFDGDGRADLLSWQTLPVRTNLYRSNGDGTFTQVPNGSGSGQFNLSTTEMFSQNGCRAALLLDMNADGLTDILRMSRGSESGCSGSSVDYLFLNNGDGSFTTKTISGVSLERVDGIGFIRPPSVSYIIDVNGDGRPDVIRATDPADTTCSVATPCTWVYLGDGQGNFSATSSNLASFRVYKDVGENGAVYEQKFVVDVDGDGLQDLMLGGSSAWRSLGNGNFESYAVPAGEALCKWKMDFNGDGRGDCLTPDKPGLFDMPTSKLSFSSGAKLERLADFVIEGNPSRFLKDDIRGVFLMDFNGDGRTDILRWHDDMLNILYLSNGDGTFRKSTTFNLGDPHPDRTHLKHHTTKYEIVAGDFLGNGSLQLIRLVDQGQVSGTVFNHLLVKSDPMPPDTLLSVTSPSGLKTTLTYAPLTSPAASPDVANVPDLATHRYVSDRKAGLTTPYPLVDLAVPAPVVITAETETGVGTATVKTEYAYRGMKAAMDGRGMLGYQQMLQQTVAPDGSPLTVRTDYFLDRPFAGVARRTETRVGPWTQPNAPLISATTNLYCDRTARSSAAPGAPLVNPDTVTDTSQCLNVGKVTRPYLLRSVEEGADPAGNALPKVTTTNRYNDYGDPERIIVTTEGSFLGANRVYTKTTFNTYCAPDSAGCANKTGGDNWILGRLSRSDVVNTVPDLRAALTASPGSAPLSAATKGVLPPGSVLPVDPAAIQAILQVLLED